ncbi:hypothetical protein CBOM_07987 [Ceraceosorus bombacis]|uniref:Uncharacterized protein n=1 Tax=Ceraceosorus bombacis TaxID=401625 RepID=A0A0P1BIP8_9BASI|nr:hypothetical protein CBOM_07987 [Ceraceosorus bombacis]
MQRKLYNFCLRSIARVLCFPDLLSVADAGISQLSEGWSIFRTSREFECIDIHACNAPVRRDTLHRTELGEYSAQGGDRVWHAQTMSMG